MKRKSTSYHLEIQTHRRNPYGLLRNSYREDGKVLHETICRLTGLSIEQLRTIQASLQNKTVPKEDFKITRSREYGASFVCVSLIKALGLHKIIYSRTSEEWVRCSLAMIAGRLVYAGSKLALSQCGEYSSLWEICGIDGDVNVNTHCYDVMDRLLERQDAIQKTLAKKHLHEGLLILYDITSSYMEGEYYDSEIVAFGYNRDKKRGHKQIVISLLCAKDGCPVAVEVLRGNTKDETTVLNRINEIKEEYGIVTMIFVGDRGMITRVNHDKIDHDTTKVITALTHAAIKGLCERGTIQYSLFDEKNIVEVIDGERRYCLCKNPDMAVKEAATRQALLKKTTEFLDRIVDSTRKTKLSKEIRAGKIVNKFKMGKYIVFEGSGENLLYRLDYARIEQDACLDGCYIVFTDASPEDLTAIETVNGYRSLAQVEQAFRNIKTVALEIRPMFHKTDNRIKCHVFICMLAYYVMWHMKRMLVPLFNADGKGAKRKHTFDNVIENLKSIRKESVEFSIAKTNVITTPTDKQSHILELLEVKI